MVHQSGFPNNHPKHYIDYYRGIRGKSRRDHNRPNLAPPGVTREIIWKPGFLWKVNKDKIELKDTVVLTKMSVDYS